MVVFLGIFLSWANSTWWRFTLLESESVCVHVSHDVAKSKKKKKNTTQVSYGCAARFQFETLLECIKANCFMAN